jgi:hypothetical protein
LSKHVRSRDGRFREQTGVQAKYSIRQVRLRSERKAGKLLKVAL